MRTKSTRKQKQAEWQQKLQDFHESGLKPVAFCRRNRIRLPVFRYWLQKLPIIKTETDVSFVEVPSSQEPLPVRTTSGYELTFKSGTKLSIGPDFNREILRSLIRILQDGTC